MAVELDTTFLPTFGKYGTATPEQKRNLFAAGLSAGTDELQGLGGSAIAAVGKAVGLQPVADFGQRIADRNAIEAQQNGRPDLEVAPWHDGGASVLPWLAYQATKQVPQLAGYIAAGALVPEAAVPAGLARFGAAVPKVLGGGGMRLGMGAAEEAAAKLAGQRFARGVVGTELAGIPVAAGSMYQEASQQPGGATQSDAFKSLALSPVYAAMDALEPELLKRGGEGKLLKRVVSKALTGAALEVPQEGLQTYMEQTFRPDLTPQQKMANVVDAAITGGAVGGVLGGVSGVRPAHALKTADPQELLNNPDALASEVDRVTQGPALGLPAPVAYTDAAGRTAYGTGGDEILRSRAVEPSPTDALVNSYAPIDQTPQIESSTIIADKQRPIPFVRKTDYTQDDLSRPYRGVSDEQLLNQLQIAEDYLTKKGEAASPAVVDAHQALSQELAARTSQNGTLNNSPDVNLGNGSLSETTDTDLAGAVERVPTGGSQGAVSSAAPAPANLTLDDMFKNVASNSIYRQAKTLEDVAILNDARLAEGKLTKYDRLIAERRGIDINARGEPVATTETGASQPEATPALAAEFKSESTPAPAAPASLEGGDRPVDVEQLNDHEVYRALGAQVVPPAIEDEAVKRGIFDANKNLTDKGRQVALQAFPTEELYSEARSQGFDGKEASSFDRGFRSVASPEDTVHFFDTDAEKAAFEAGQRFASRAAVPDVTDNPEIRRPYQIQDTLDPAPAMVSRSAETGEGQREQVARTRIDALFPITTHPEANAQLHRMVSEGANAQQLNDVARYFESGQGALAVPDAPVRPRDPNIRDTMFGPTRIPEGGTTPDDLVREADRQARAEQVLQQRAEGGKAGQRATATQLEDQFRSRSGLKAARRDIIAKAAEELNAKRALDQEVAARELRPDENGVIRERSEGDGSGVTAEQAQRAIAAAIRNWKSKIKVTVYDSITDVPAVYRDRFSSDEVAGFHDPSDRSIHIIAGNHASLEGVKATLYHEALGHEGLRAAFGEQLDQLLKDIYRTNPAMRAAANEYLLASGKWADQPADVRGRNAVEEVFAEGSEQGRVSASAWERLVSLVRTFGRKLGLRLDYTGAEVQTILARAHDAVVNGYNASSGPLIGAVPQINERARDTIRQVTSQVDNLKERAGGARDRFRKAFLYAASRHDIIEHDKRLAPNLPGWAAALTGFERNDNQRSTLVASQTKFATKALDRVDALKRAERSAISQLATATQFPFDPTKSWKEQADAVRSEFANLQAAHNEYFQLFRKLSPEGKAAFNDLRATNDMQLLSFAAVKLHQAIAKDTYAADALGANLLDTPLDRFVREYQGSDPTEARTWWVAKAAEQAAKVKAFLDTQDKGAKGKYADVDEARSELLHALKTIEDKPYFHLPRFGEYFLDWHVKDATALSRLADALEAEGIPAVISRASEQTHVFMRFESKSQRNAAHAIIDAHRTDGSVTALKAGVLAQEGYAQGLITTGLNHLIDGIDSNHHLDDKTREAVIADLRKTAIDLMPENSIIRVMTQRKNVLGFHTDMLRGYAQRAKIGADSLANLVTAPKVAQSFADMRDAVKTAQAAPLSGEGAVSLDDRDAISQTVDELSRRTRQRAEWGHNRYLDMLSRITSAHYLGLSPAFAFVQFTQLGATAWPELGARHGFLNAAREIANATPQAMKIAKAIFGEGLKVSKTRAMDAVITREALDAAGIDGRKAEYLMRLVNTGQLDIGGQIRELVRSAEGMSDDHVDKVLRYATSLGYYAETTTRLVAAIAHYNLNKHLTVEQAAQAGAHVLSETMFDMSPENWGRLFGKKGFLGPATPLATKFMQYQAQMLGKLYREAHNAWGGDPIARRFLKGHLAAMTVMAGTLGLPLVTAFAAAFDRLKDLFDDDDEPSDIRMAYRQYLSDVFGNELEPILTKGAFRAAGIDVSQRIGEQDIIPFSRFFADKRNIKDSLTDLQSRSWGAPTSMVTAYANGIAKISDGDLLGGMIAALPIGLANPLKAIRMEAGGRFVDANGNTLPVEPSVADVIAQAIGFNPGQNADYSDRRGAQKTLDRGVSDEASKLRDKAVQALSDRDAGRFKDIAAEIAAFDRRHAGPGRPSVMGSIMASYRRQLTQQRNAATTGQPLGVKPGAGRYSFGDIAYRAQ